MKKIIYLLLPVRAGIVANPKDYIYSSASNYIDGKGIINVETVEIPKVDVLNSSPFDKYLRQS